VDFAGALVNGLLTIVGYFVIFLGVYKVYQIATDIREIKDLVASAGRNSVGVAAVKPGPAPVITKDLLAEDSAAAYAQGLLRAVNAESHVKQNEPHEVR
jgi:hypothetical protein